MVKKLIFFSLQCFFNLLLKNVLPSGAVPMSCAFLELAAGTHNSHSMAVCDIVLSILCCWVLP